MGVFLLGAVVCPEKDNKDGEWSRAQDYEEGLRELGLNLRKRRLFLKLPERRL